MMRCYKSAEDALCREELKKFPPLDVEKCNRQANSLFTPYLFFRRSRGSMEMHCSSCLKSGTISFPKRIVTSADQALMEGRHNETAVCPFCGEDVTLKELFRLGKKKNLEEYHPVVFLATRKGELFAQAFWATKDYNQSFTTPPLFMQTAAYCFRLGRAEMYEKDYYGTKLRKKIVEGDYSRKSHVTEPFIEGKGYCPYTVFGREAIAKSDFRYCQYDMFHRPETLDCDMMKYLALYSVYPRKVEMLMKSGMECLVEDMLFRKVKNARVLDWREDDMKKAFGLDGQEMRAFRQSGAWPYIIGDYKRLKKKGLKTDFPKLEAIQREIYCNYDEFINFCVKESQRPERVVSYLRRHAGQKGLNNAWITWRDYRRMADELDWDLADETVMWPKDLNRRHDEAVKELNLKHEREKREAEREAVIATQKNLKRRRKKYNFAMNGYFIRIAETPEEIRREGKTLCHCVGGYAERHMADKTTILFCRRAETPEASLYTIEMDGNTLRQIHGYQNSWPEKKMEWLLSPWLAWLEKGSPRDKEGNPKIPKIKTKETKTA